MPVNALLELTVHNPHPAPAILFPTSSSEAAKHFPKTLPSFVYQVLLSMDV